MISSEKGKYEYVNSSYPLWNADICFKLLNIVSWLSFTVLGAGLICSSRGVRYCSTTRWISFPNSSSVSISSPIHTLKIS